MFEIGDTPIDKPDLDVWNVPEMRAALARRDIPAVYWRLKGYGYSQRQIAALTGQSQSEVSEIVKGREVQKVTTLERIADGLGIPHGYLGLAWTEDPTYRQEQEEPARDEVDDDVKRRTAVLNSAAAMLFGRPVLGEVVAIAAPAADPVVPQWLTAADVTALKALTAELRKLGRAGQGGMPDVLEQVATWAERNLRAPAVDKPSTLQKYSSALAELHTLAGWCCYDMQYINQSRWHYLRAMQLAKDAGDVIEMASSLWHAAIGEIELGAPDDALKYCQMAQIKLGEAPDSTPGKAEYQTRLHARAACAYANLDQPRPDRVQDELKSAMDLPEITDPFERAAGLDHVRAITHLTLGNLNTAESFASSAIRTWGESDLREGVHTRILLARIHLQAHERGVERIAAPAIKAVAELPSMRARTMLAPLEQALRVRGDSTSVDLAEKAHLVRQGAG